MSILKTSVWIFIFAQGCNVATPTINPVDTEHGGKNAQMKRKDISREEAIAIVERDALKNNRSLSGFNVIPCEQALFWRIIFDRGGLEYVLDKTSGAIRKVQNIPHESVLRNSKASLVRSDKGINMQKAIAIAKKDAGESIPGEDMERFSVIACELAEVWRIFIEFKYNESDYAPPIIPHSSAPNYVIDKKTGDIIFKERD
jgi:hypothetical protein